MTVMRMANAGNNNLKDISDDWKIRVDLVFIELPLRTPENVWTFHR